MGLASEAFARLSGASTQSLFVLAGLVPVTLLVLVVILNVLQQLLFKDPRAPPLVFHWFPVIGSTIVYGIDPYDFFFANRKKYGDTFTFVLLGKKVTVCLGPKGSDFVLNGKLKDVCAEDVYGHLCTPVFGTDVVYDCPNSKLMEQKKFVKFGLTNEALRSYVELITQETRDFARDSPQFQGNEGIVNITAAMAELTIYTASASLQGKEVRSRFDSTFATLFHDLDAGFSPINFMLPWAPLPHNRKRDAAREKMASLYLDIIKSRRESGKEKDSEDMIWNLMNCTYKNGIPVPDKEVAHMMIALLMAGQHSSSATSAWILLRLSTRPDIVEELLEEQKRVLGEDLPPITNDNLPQLLLNSQVVKETLRIHVPIHSIMRNVKSPMPMEGTSYIIPTSHWVLASPGASSRMDQYFPDPLKWEPHRWDSDNDKKEVDDDEKVDFGYGLVSKGANSPYIPFGAGRHRCIGEQFAYIQLGAIIATWVRLFKLSPIGDLPGTDYSSLFSRPLNPAKLRWERREKIVEKS